MDGHPRGPVLTVQFGEMESCTDDLVVGCPQSMEWGLSICNVPGSATPSAHLMRPNLELQIVKWFPNPQLSSTMSVSGSRGRGKRTN